MSNAKNGNSNQTMLIITHHEDITRSHLKAGIFKNPKIISPQSNQESLHIKTPNNDEMNVEESVVNDLVEGEKKKTNGQLKPNGHAFKHFS